MVGHGGCKHLLASVRGLHSWSHLFVTGCRGCQLGSFHHACLDLTLWPSSGRVLLHSVLYSAFTHEIFCPCSLVMWVRKRIFSGNSLHSGSFLFLIRGLQQAASNHLVPLKRKDNGLLNSKITIRECYFSSMWLIIHEAALFSKELLPSKVLDLIYG